MSNRNSYVRRSPAPSPSSRGSRSDSIEALPPCPRSTPISSNTNPNAVMTSTDPPNPTLDDDGLVGRLLLNLFPEEEPTQLLAPAARELSTTEVAQRLGQRDVNGLAAILLAKGGYRVFEFTDDGEETGYEEREGRGDSPTEEESPKPQRKMRTRHAGHDGRGQLQMQLVHASSDGIVPRGSAEETEREQSPATELVPDTAHGFDMGKDQCEQEQEVRIKREPSVWYEVEYGPGGRRATVENWATRSERRDHERMLQEKQAQQGQTPQKKQARQRKTPQKKPEQQKTSHEPQQPPKTQEKRKKNPNRLSGRARKRLAARGMPVDRRGRILEPDRHEEKDVDNQYRQNDTCAAKDDRRLQDVQDMARHKLKARVMEGTASNEEIVQYRAEQEGKKRKTRALKRVESKKARDTFLGRVDGIKLDGEPLLGSCVRDMDRLTCGEEGDKQKDWTRDGKCAMM